MRPIIAISLTGELVSAIQAHGSAPELALGLQVKLTADYETPWGPVKRGSTGRVVAIDSVHGLVDIRMDHEIPALVIWQNTLTLMPFVCDDLLACLQIVPEDNRLPDDKKEIKCTPSLMASLSPALS